MDHVHQLDLKLCCCKCLHEQTYASTDMRHAHTLRLQSTKPSPSITYSCYTLQLVCTLYGRELKLIGIFRLPHSVLTFNCMVTGLLRSAVLSAAEILAA